jgi:hypothetical protein
MRLIGRNHSRVLWLCSTGQPGSRESSDLRNHQLADTPGLVDAAQRAHERGALVFVVNHIVEDQLAATEYVDRRTLLLNTWVAMPKALVMTHGAVWGLSRWYQAAWGDGRDSGVMVPRCKPADGAGFTMPSSPRRRRERRMCS